MDNIAITQAPSLRERVRQILLAQIMSGELMPGEVYSVGQFAAMLKVSPTPIREAVLDLARSNYLEIHKNVGFSIPEVTPEELEELHKIRMLLEVPATVEAGMLMDQGHIKHLTAIAEATVEAAHSSDVVAYIDVDRRFHSTFLEPLRMPHLSELIINYKDRARLRGLRAKLGSREIVAAATQHLELVTAASRRDENALKRIITDHIESTRSRWQGA
ncbi:GntR family transcriptional regulator [Aminobacter ciceronei]|uniref:DNA-binding GntR family transcriptional regulator n=1 Tax=Aminobacter ciceronei TaxID=150723 RepID=A0ABR6CF25_9HYPH|nr:GntR family transcriptional regulator [Aminobacter ciceronei]MBA8909884.1 DNA-binding GntR family transcriptional regulator [Aminobacter ciceronei]MBA9023656.1 DNA-binding GntR family transcriptional regulator [Aminobacter ciceronei]